MHKRVYVWSPVCEKCGNNSPGEYFIRKGWSNAGAYRGISGGYTGYVVQCAKCRHQQTEAEYFQPDESETNVEERLTSYL